MRHGESKANLKEIIISHPVNGAHAEFALSEHGREQATASVSNSHLTDRTVIYSSDFSRALETAEIAKNLLGTPDMHVTKLLRERYFGDWEETHNSNYAKVWEYDERSPDHTENNVESLNSGPDPTDNRVGKALKGGAQTRRSTHD